MTREARLFLFALLWVLNGFQFQRPALAQDDARWQSVSDAATGITLELPLAVLTEQKSTKWGTNWSSPDGSINIDALAYPKGQTLTALHAKMRAIKGRMFSKDEVEPEAFVLAGKTADGSTFFVDVREKDETIKGVSILYTSKRKKDGPGLVERLAKGFTPFVVDAQKPSNTQLFTVSVPAMTAASVSVAPNIDKIDSGETVTFSPDGRLLASSAGYGADSIKIWQVASGRLVRTLHYYAYFLAAVFAPDGKSLITGHKDGRIKFWNLETGESTVSILAGSDLGDTVDERMPVHALWIDPNGKLLVTGDDSGRVSFWDLEQMTLLKKFDLDIFHIVDVHLTADGQRVVAVGVNQVKTVDVDSGRITAMSQESGDNPPYEPWSIIGDTHIAYPAADAPCAVETLYVQELSVAETKPKPVASDKPSQCARTEGNDDFGQLKAFRSADGKHMVVARRGTAGLKIIDTATWKLNRTIDWPDQSSADVVEVSTDLTLAVTNRNGRLRVHKFETGAVVSELAAVGDSEAYSVATHTNIIMQHTSGAAATGSSIRTWQLGSLSSQDATITIGSEDRILDLSDDGQQVLTAQQKQSLVILTTGGETGGGKELKRWSVPGMAEITGARLFPGGKMALVRGNVSEQESSTGQESRIQVIDTSDGRTLHTLKQPAAGDDGLGSASALAVSEDGTHVAAGYWFGTIAVWRADTGKLVARSREIEGAIFTIRFSKDGTRLLYGTRDDDVYAWDWKQAGSGHTTTFDLERDRSGYVVATSVAWSRDGKAVVAGVGLRASSSNDTGSDTSIRVWEAATGKLLHKLEGHSHSVATVTFSPDDRWIVSGSYDGTIRYWDRQTGKLAITIAATDGGRWLAITDRGFFAGSPGSEDLISVVRGFESYSVAQFRKHLYRPDLVEQLLKGDPTRLYADAVHGLDLAKILESGSAPQIEPLPGRKAEQANDTVRVTLRITDTGGGIGKGVDWRVNGVTSGGDEAPPAASAEELASGFRIVSQTLRVDPTQKNEIEVTAYNGEGLLASAPYRLVVDPFGVTSAPRARMFILSVGVSNYDNKDWSLKYAARDAADFASSMEAVAKGGPYEQVRLTVIPEAEATRGGIDAAFKKIKDDVRPTDVFILFVAGHGRTVQSTGTYYFLPRDLTFEGGKSVEDGIGQDQWQTWLKQIAAQKSILIFDTCESSAAAGLTRGEKERETAVDRLRDATGRSVITAARQAAYEGYKEHGVLTYAILDALSEIAGQPSTEVDLYQLAAHVDREVPSISKSLFGVAQRPHNKIEGNFPLGMRKAGLIATQGSSATSTVPTHVMVRAERVRARPAADTQGDRELAPGTQVYVLKYSGDWAAVGRDGQPLGYVPADALVRLQ